MKALSIKQPWINLILVGEKTIEVRSRNTSNRGDILLCSSKSPALKKEVMREFEELIGLSYLFGHALCVARLVDSRPLRRGDEEAAFVETVNPKMCGWVLESIRPVVPFPVKGKLGFYKVDDDLIDVSPYAMGDCVRIREDVDGSELGVAIGGWLGRVVDYELPGDYGWVYGVMLDTVSLGEVPESWLEACVAEDAIWHTLLLDADDLEPAEPRETWEETWEAVEEIERQHPKLFPEDEAG